MNIQHRSLMLALLASLGLTAAADAHGPTTRQRVGVIKSIDARTRSLEFESGDKSVPRVLTWSRRTVFYANGNEAGPGALRPGQSVELRYGVPFFGPPYVSKVRVLSPSPQPATRKTKP